MQTLRRKMDSMLNTEQFTYKQIKDMFLTLCLDQFFIFFIGMLSTAMVSSIGEAAIAAVSMVGTLNGMVSLMFTSLAAGGAILVARAKGGGDREAIRSAIGEVTGLCCAVAMVLSVLLYTLAETLVRALYGDVEPLLVQYAVQYLHMMSLSFVPYSIFNAIFNIFRNLGDTRSSLVLTVIINLIHLVLSLVFINFMGLGVMGSGLSYLVARCIGVIMALVWLLALRNDYHVRVRDFFHFTPSVTRQIISLGMPVAVEAMLMQGGMLLVQVYLAKLTTAEMAAHAVANSIFQLYAITYGALTALTSTVAGQCYGAKRYDLTRFYTKNLIKIGRVVMLVTVLILYPLTPLLLKLYHATEAGTPIIYSALRIGVIALPLLWCDAYLPSMTMRAAGDGVFTGGVSVVCLIAARCALGYVLTIPLGLGVPGVWIALAVEWLMRAVVLHIRFRGDRWLHLAA